MIALESANIYPRKLKLGSSRHKSHFQINQDEPCIITETVMKYGAVKTVKNCKYLKLLVVQV